jgi:NAD+ diphosphatase
VSGPDGVAHLAFHGPDEVPALSRRFLGVSDEGVPYFTVTTDALPADGDWLTLRDVATNGDELAASLFATATALEQWHARHTHCPRCGAPTVEAQAGWTRVCTVDRSEHFPRTDPAVIMLVEDGELALLGRSPAWPPGRFSTLAGFVEPGETLEAAVAREVEEEVGVAIRDIRYVASQPWPFPASLMLGFRARLDGSPAVDLDAEEMAEAGWFTRDDVARARDWTDEHEAPDPDGPTLQAIPPRLSISRYLIDSWLADRPA